MSLGGGGLLGTVEVAPAGVVLLPGVQGVAAVAEVPLGRDGVAEATVELELLPVPLLVVGVLGDVLGDALGVVEVVLPGVVVVEVEVPVLVLLEGVQGATVVEVPVWFCMLPVVPPVTDPALPATPGVPCVIAGLPVELAPGCDVGRVPAEPVDPGCVVAEPGWVVVPGCDCVVGVPVCVPMPGLGVTVPVLCAVAMPTARANTDDANKILRIESCSLCTSVAGSFSHWDHSLSKALLHRWDAFSGVERCRGRVAGSHYLRRLRNRDFDIPLAGPWRVGQMRYFASILPPVLKIKCEFLLCKLIRERVFERMRIIFYQGKRFELIVNA